MWPSGRDNTQHLEWTHEYWAAIQPFRRSGAYVNYLDGTTDQTATAAFGANALRLARVKAKYDPENVFHLNQNILPVANDGDSSGPIAHGPLTDPAS
jgi:FAD/FMN-containing dehydrogenase